MRCVPLLAAIGPLLFSTVLAWHSPSNYTAVCEKIAGSISSASEVFYPGSNSYKADILHFSSNAAEPSACSVEPGSVADVSFIMKLISRHRTPFAVKGGGHNSNPGFSSTSGIQIAMVRLNEVSYDKNTSTASVGAGLIWDDVYTALEPYGVTVVGGRAPGIGVAGLTLGGGYSFLTNQYGLVIDNVVAFEVVLPSGQIVIADCDAYSDLFWALKGAGQVNFGIVTRFIFITHPLGQVWGGSILFSTTALEDFAAAVLNFTSSSTDPKASFIPSFLTSNIGNQSVSIPEVLLFYAEPTPPPGLFDVFLSLPVAATPNISTRSLTSLIQAGSANSLLGTRGYTQSFPLLKLSPTLLAQTINQTLVWGTQMASHPSPFVGISLEPFLPSAFSHATPRALPHNRVWPSEVFYTWFDEADDKFWQAAVLETAALLQAQAIAEGQQLTGNEALLYSNYAAGNTPIELLWGDNVPALQAIKHKYDPSGVMNLAGGFKL